MGKTNESGSDTRSCAVIQGGNVSRSVLHVGYRLGRIVIKLQLHFISFCLSKIVLKLEDSGRLGLTLTFQNLPILIIIIIIRIYIAPFPEGSKRCNCRCTGESSESDRFI